MDVAVGFESSRPIAWVDLGAPNECLVRLVRLGSCHHDCPTSRSTHCKHPITRSSVNYSSGGTAFCPGRRAGARRNAETCSYCQLLLLLRWYYSQYFCQGMAKVVTSSAVFGSPQTLSIASPPHACCTRTAPLDS